jgi:hypothetical protein
MPQRSFAIDGETWAVTPSGYSTVYGKDQFGLAFTSGAGPARKRRFTRYAPVGNRSPDAALAELSDAALLDLWRHSQPAWTAPESAYGAR